MAAYEQEIKQYETKMRAAETMTGLLTAMSSLKSFADSLGLSAEERRPVDQAYMEAEARLITQVKPTLW